MILIYIEHLGRQIKILKEHILIMEFILKKLIGKICVNQYLSKIGIFVVSILYKNIEGVFMAHIYQEYNLQM